MNTLSTIEDLLLPKDATAASYASNGSRPTKLTDSVFIGELAEQVGAEIERLKAVSLLANDM